MQKIDFEHRSDRRTIRKASMDDLPIIMDFLRQGREKMIAVGNLNQWRKGYPAQQTIEQDIQ